jgi:hypothetical protein
MYTKGHYVLILTPYYYPKKLIFAYLMSYVCLNFFILFENVKNIDEIRKVIVHD